MAPSLIPYLGPGSSGFFLDIPLRSEHPAELDRPVSPFLRVIQSGPFARIVEARFATDAGGEIKRVFVLVQEDEYRLSQNEIWPVSNVDVDRCWQQAFSFYSGNKQDSTIIFLSAQITGDRQLAPFRSLFFCKVKRRFFHPVCPECGSFLEQCYDDDLLRAAGLPAYSDSLRRYLFCPSCLTSNGKSFFYTRLSDSADPPETRDCSDLIRCWGDVVDPDRSPCRQCPEQQACYGKDVSALSRIVPFSFYPFFMFIFDAPTVSGMDFLALVSGASYDELESRLSGRQESGRARCLRTLKQSRPERVPAFLFEGEDRHFPEVLYLKVCFLSELVPMFFPELNRVTFPDPGLSIERVWVRIGDQKGLLPLLWNFSVSVIDVAGSPSQAAFISDTPSSRSLFYLGLVWFCALLVNKRQEIAQVCDAVRALVEAEQNRDGGLEAFPGRDDPAFSPKEIFWDPDTGIQGDVPEEFESLWVESLGLGWSLIRAALKGADKWSENTFLSELESLRDRVKAGVFQPQSKGPVDTVDGRANREIRKILEGIREKWGRMRDSQKQNLEEPSVLSASTGQGPCASDVVSRGDGDVQRTVVLSPDGFAQDSRSDVRMADPLPLTGSDETPSEDLARDDGNTARTVTLSSGTPVMEPGPAGHEDDMDETVVLSPGVPGRASQEPVRTEVPLDKTTILPPGGAVEEHAASKRRTDDDFPQTVIIHPSDLQERKSRAGHSSGPEKEAPGPSAGDHGQAETSGGRRPVGETEDDSLDETVILRPEGLGKKND